MPSDTPAPCADIQPVNGLDELRLCAALMAESEPWLTLKRDADHSVKLLQQPGCEVYLARVDGAPVGHVAVNVTGPLAGYVHAIVVAPDWRSRGIGAELLGFAERRIFRASPNVFLCVSEFNTRAQAFYQRLGYERVGELKNYVLPGKSEILLRKTIASKSEFARI
jgi:[ribosomal protein S18]-alanine N-acetyltransferase